jgi:regulator of protease activity HflC (stomatin/prohibitin superfamily)
LSSGVEAADHARAAALLQMAPRSRPLTARKAQMRRFWYSRNGGEASARQQRNARRREEYAVMRKSSSLQTLAFFVVLAIGLGVAWMAAAPPFYFASDWIAAAAAAVALIAAAAIRVADQWQRAVVLRLGKFRALEGPGLFLIIPIIETVPYWIDTRVLASAFKAEKTLTKDTVPVDVDAVLFWKVIDPKKAALDVADYNGAINWAAQTALRDVIGKTLLADMLEGRDKISADLQKIIDERTEPWGVNVISVEVKDVLIPPALQDAMSMQAQAERERQARVILGDSERQVAEKFGEAAKTYADNPTAFHLRAMNMLYEGLKRDNATIVIVPSTAVDTMQLGATIASLSTMATAKAAPPAPAPGA